MSITHGIAEHTSSARAQQRLDELRVVGPLVEQHLDGGAGEAGNLLGRPLVARSTLEVVVHHVDDLAAQVSDEVVHGPCRRCGDDAVGHGINTSGADEVDDPLSCRGVCVTEFVGHAVFSRKAKTSRSVLREQVTQN